MTLARSLLFLVFVPTLGCAAVFRDPKVKVAIESDPPKAEAFAGTRPLGPTPTIATLDRSKPHDVRVTAPGYTESRRTVPKHANAAWVTIDVITCVIPVALCIPLIVDALSGAWYDVDETYRVTLSPERATPPPFTPGSPAPPPSMTAPPATAPSPSDTQL